MEDGRRDGEVEDEEEEEDDLPWVEEEEGEASAAEVGKKFFKNYFFVGERGGWREFYRAVCMRAV